MTDWAYFDYSASTPPDARVLARFQECAQRYFANSGAAHDLGLAAKRIVEQSRQEFAQAIGAQAAEIVFTSGATEADNLALKGACLYQGAKNPRLISLQSEHKAVIDTAGALAAAGVAVEFLPVQTSGLLDLALLEQALQAKPTTLVSVMAVNNETGVVQPLAAIAQLAHRYGAKLHVDAAQALGKMAVDVRAWDADAVSFSGHKVYAPPGIGALYVRRMPKMRLAAQLHGGGQERSRRSGTLPLPLIAAFAQAVQLSAQELPSRSALVRAYAEKLLAALPSVMQHNGNRDWDFALEKGGALPHILSIDTARPAAEVLAAANAAKLALSAGSACQSAADEGSHVLQAMGLQAAANRSIRISLSHLTQAAEIERLVQFLQELR